MAATSQALRLSAIAPGCCSADGRLTIYGIRRLRQTPGKAREPTQEPPLPCNASLSSPWSLRLLRQEPTGAHESLHRRPFQDVGSGADFLSLPTFSPLVPVSTLSGNLCNRSVDSIRSAALSVVIGKQQRSCVFVFLPCHSLPSNTMRADQENIPPDGNGPSYVIPSFLIAYIHSFFRSKRLKGTNDPLGPL